MTLRDYQKQAIEKIKAKRAAGVLRLLLKFATGLGKTPLFASLPDELGLSGRVMVLDHRTELTDQALDKLKKWNPGRSIGVEMGTRRSSGEQLVVAGVQTVGRKGSPRLTQFNPSDFDALVIDEVHHATATSYRTVIDHFTQNPKLLLLGVTATPNRADGEGLGSIFQEIVDDRDILFGITHGWLVEMRGIRIKTGVSLNNVHSVAGDFNQGELGNTVNTPARNDLIVRSWLEHAKDRQTVMFAVDVQHCQDLAAAFSRYGVAAQAIWGNDPHRDAKLKAHRECKIQVLINCQLLTEGYDDWRVSCIGDAAPTQSEGRYVQKIGRGTRIPDGIGNLLEARKRGIFIAKDECIILDFVDSTSKHSLVTLPTLFGMKQDTDLRGKAISKIVAEIEKVKRRNPLLDLTRVDDVNKLQSYAEQVDLFKVSFPPEIIQLSEYQWHRTGVNAYVLALLNNESVTVIGDMLDKWHIVGDVNGYKVRDERLTFEEAIKEADYKVGMLGGRGLRSLVSREAAWKRLPPTPAQLVVCRRMGIVVPQGATKGEVSDKLTQTILQRKQKRAQRQAV